MKTLTEQGSGIRVAGGVILHVSDLPAMTAWYGDILGIPVGETDPERPFYEFDMDNGVNLMLDDHRNVPGRPHPFCMFKTPDIRRSYEWAQRNGIPIELDIRHVHEGLDFFHIRDSEDNVLMIVQSDWKNPNPIRPYRNDLPIRNRIQSIVVPVDDLKRATEWYARLLGHAIKPERQDGGPIYWFELENGTHILLDDNRHHREWEKYPTFMLNAPRIEEAYRFMKEKNVRILHEIEFDHHFFAADPEGNAMIVCM